MSLTAIAVLIVGLFLVLTSQQPASSTLQLIVGIAVAVLVLLDGRAVFQRLP